jgi:hypothetical protein
MRAAKGRKARNRGNKWKKTAKKTGKEMQAKPMQKLKANKKKKTDVDFPKDPRTEKCKEAPEVVDTSIHRQNAVR